MINIFYQKHKIPADNSGKFTILSYWDEETIAGITAAYERGEYESVPDVIPPVEPDWLGFRLAMIPPVGFSSFETWLGQAKLTYQQAVTAAAMNADTAQLQELYEILKQQYPPTPEQISEWQEVANNYHIGLFF